MLTRLFCCNPIVPPQSRGHLDRVMRRGNKYFVRIHTTGKLSLRMIKQTLWSEFPVCGVTGTILCTSPTRYIIQMLIVLGHYHSKEDVVEAIQREFAPHLIDNEVSDGRLSSIAICEVRTPAQWSLYCYQIHISQNEHDDSDTVLVVTSYGNDDTNEAIVTRPNREDVLTLSRDPALLHVMQPAISIDHSSLVPLEKIEQITNLRNSMKQLFMLPRNSPQAEAPC